MKILLITDRHLPSGGAEKYFFELKEKLKKIPHFNVYSLGFGDHFQRGDDFLILPAPISKVKKLIWQIFFHPFVFLKIKKYLKQCQPDIIHLHNIKQYSYTVLQALKNYPVIQTVHDYNLICPVGFNIHKNNRPCEHGFHWRCFWQHHMKHSILIYLARVFCFLKLKKYLKKRVHTFLSPSPLLASYLEKNHFPNVFYLPLFKPSKKEMKFDAINDYHFLFVGSLTSHKGIHLLIDEFILALKNNKKLILKIAGTGPEEKNIRKKVQTLQLEKNIIFLGWQEQLESLYQTAIGIIFTSICMESFGLIHTEAMSQARPMIAVNRGTSAWLIEENQTGLLFDPNERGDLAKKILQLAGNVTLAKRLGKNAYEKLDTLMDNNDILRHLVHHYRHLSTER